MTGTLKRELGRQAATCSPDRLREPHGTFEPHCGGLPESTDLELQTQNPENLTEALHDRAA